MFKKTLFLFLFLIVSAGCSQRVMMLKGLASSQKQMERYIARQERGFSCLKKDIQSNRLQKGISRDTLTQRYGESVFCGVQKNPADPEISQSCLYRSPTEYFSADKVYLYFDRQELLYSWKYESAEN